MIQRRRSVDANTEFHLRENELDAQKDDFPFIHLSKSQLRLLKKSNDVGIAVTDNNKFDALHLRDLNLIKINRTTSGETENVDFCEIRPRGINYLQYLEGDRSRTSREHVHDWMIAVFTAFAGALLSRPLWFGIDWLLEIIRTIAAR